MGRIHPRTHFALPIDVVVSRQLTFLDKAVYVVVCARAAGDHDHVVTLTHTQIAEDTGCSVRSAARSLDRLEAFGAVRITRRSGEPATYRVAW